MYFIYIFYMDPSITIITYPSAWSLTDFSYSFSITLHEWIYIENL